MIRIETFFNEAPFVGPPVGRSVHNGRDVNKGTDTGIKRNSLF